MSEKPSRNAALEEAAKLAESYGNTEANGHTIGHWIRCLKKDADTDSPKDGTRGPTRREGVGVMKHRIPFTERILCSPAEAGEALDKGKTQIFAMIAQGKLRTVKHGSRRHVYVASVLEVAGVQHGSPSSADSNRVNAGTENTTAVYNVVTSNS